MKLKTLRITRTACVLVVLAQFAATSVAGPLERGQAKRIHDRIAGVPPTPEVLDQMEAIILSGNVEGAANIAIEAPEFYNVTLKNFVTPWTNREQTVFAPLNDYTATVIGAVRDGADFRRILSDDILYTVNGVTPAASASNNSHYEAAETNGTNLKIALQPTQQSSIYGIPSNATAGIITSRAASQAFFIDGTNRAMFRFTLVNHLCRDMEQVQDTSRPPDRIRQDVSRSPGGDSRIFLNNCIGCHSGMDPMAQAFAYYDFDETQNRLVYTDGMPNAKYFINADNFRPGFVTPNDSWENRWRHGPNSALGWNNAAPAGGSGAKSLGQELASSEAFAQCQVEKVFKAVCFRAPADGTDVSQITTIKNDFKTSNYNLKKVWAETAVYCKGP